MNSMVDQINLQISTSCAEVKKRLKARIQNRFDALKTELADKFKLSQDNLEMLKDDCERYPGIMNKHEKQIDKMLIFQKYLDERIGRDIKEAKE